MSSPLLTDILAYWNLNNNGSGGVSLSDSTGNGNTLTNNNGVTLGTGIIAGDAVFDSTNYLSSPLQLNSYTAFSFSCWANTDQSLGQMEFLGQRDYNNGALFFFYYGDIYFNINNGVQINANANYADGTWHYIVGTWDGSTANLYIDGSNVATGSYSGSITASSTLWLGSTSEGNITNQRYLGQLDEIGIWSRALSPSEVTALYNGGAGLTYPFTALYFNGAINNDWGTLGNWWTNPSFTIPATSLPDSITPVEIYADVLENTDGDGTCYCFSAQFYSSSFYAPLVLNSTGVINFNGTGGVFDGTATDGISFHDTCSLGENGYITGDATFRDSSTNSFGTVHGNAFFYESSYNYGQIDGNATVYYSGGLGTYPIGGTVTGTVTYIGWPALSPQWFNDQASGGADDGDFSNPANWWTDDTYTTRPVNAEGTQEIPDASTDVFIATGLSIYANTGTANPTINSLTGNGAELANISITISNGATFSGDGWGIYQATVYGDVTFNSGSWNQQGVINGTATYTSASGLQGAWNSNSLGNIGGGASYGSTGFVVNISGGGGGGSLATDWISRLLHLPWFINV